MPTPSPNGWNEWSKYVLKELERLNACYEKIDNRLDMVQDEITKLKIKAGIWGLVAGAVPVAIALTIKLL